MIYTSQFASTKEMQSNTKMNINKFVIDHRIWPSLSFSIFCIPNILKSNHENKYPSHFLPLLNSSVNKYITLKKNILHTIKRKITKS